MGREARKRTWGIEGGECKELNLQGSGADSRESDKRKKKGKKFCMNSSVSYLPLSL